MNVLSANDTALSVAITALADGAPVVGANASRIALELGSVSYAGQRSPNVKLQQGSDHYTVSTRFGLTVHDPSARVGTASITASVVYPSRIGMRLDGMKLDAAPRLLMAHVPVGRLSIHHLEIDVPNDLSADASAIVNYPIQFAAIPE